MTSTSAPKPKKFLLHLNNNLIELYIEGTKVDVVLAKAIIDEIIKLKITDFSNVDFVIKTSLMTIFTQTARELIASFMINIKFNKIAYLAQNQSQISNGNLLVKRCEKEVQIKICYYEKEIKEWISSSNI